MSEELEMNLDLDEAKATGEDSNSADAVSGTGGAVKKRKGDLKKKVDAKADDIEDDVKTPQGTNDAGLKESIERMFEGTDLSEDFKTQTVAIFEAAVHEKVLAETATLEEKFESDLQEQVDATVDELVEKVDQYLDYVVESWMEENKVAVETGLRAEIAESFITGLKGLFEQHYVEVPETKYDLVDDLATKVGELEEQLNKSTEDNIKLNEQVCTMRRDQIITEATQGMVEIDAAKLKNLVEAKVYPQVGHGIETYAPALKFIGEKINSLK